MTEYTIDRRDYTHEGPILYTDPRTDWETGEITRYLNGRVVDAAEWHDAMERAGFVSPPWAVRMKAETDLT